jgi:ParB family chromosome partitioning protein
MVGHLGKGLGALFPSLSPVPTTRQANPAMRPAAQNAQRPANDQFGRQETAQSPLNSSQPQSQQGQPKQPQGQQLPGQSSRGKLSREQPKLSQEESARSTTSAASSPSHAQASRTDAVDSADTTDTRAGASSSRSRTGRRGASHMRMPGWDEIAHPVDLFFGGTDLAAVDDDVVADDNAAHAAVNGRRSSAGRAGRAEHDSATEDGARTASHSTVSGMNVSRETSERDTERDAEHSQRGQRTAASSGNSSAAASSAAPDDASDKSAAGSDKSVAGSSQDVVVKPLKPVNGAYLTQIAVDDIVPNPKQPRTVFDEDELNELADSIKEVGVLQPVVVIRRSQSPLDESDESGHDKSAHEEPDSKNSVASDHSTDRAQSDQPADRPESDHSKDASEATYELVMGERRWRASKIAGLKTIPAIVRTATSEQMLRDALLENLQRVQLNPLEEAAAYQQMMQEFGLTQKQLSEAVSKSRPQIANTLRLLQLPGSVQKLVASGVLSAGHARALLTLRSTRQMADLADRIVKEGLSVRSTEEIVALHTGKNAAAKRASSQRSADYWAGTGLPGRLEDHLQTKVSIRGNEKKGRIVITFASHEDLDRLTQLLTGGNAAGSENSGNENDGWI